jgi:hypothetical protein
MLAHDKVIDSQNESFFVRGISSTPVLEVDKKIRSFLMENPFCAPKALAVLSALEWREILSNAGFSDIDAFPGHNGEILVSGISGEYCFEVIVEDDITYSIAFEKKDELVFSSEKIPFAEARAKLDEATSYKWISSDGSIQLILINVRTDLRA